VDISFSELHAVSIQNGLLPHLFSFTLQKGLGLKRAFQIL